MSEVAGTPSESSGSSLLSDILSTGREWVQAGQYSEAAAVFGEGIKTLTRANGEYHPDVVACCVELGDLCNKVGGHAEDADSLFEHAVKAVEETKGHDHPNVSYRLEDLAGTYARSERFSEADSQLDRARVLAFKAGDKVAMSLVVQRQALLRLSQKRWGEAKSYGEEAIQILTSMLGNRHPQVAASMCNLAYACENLGEVREAGRLYCEAVEIGQQVLGNNPKMLMRLLVNRMKFLQRTQNDLEAEKVASVFEQVQKEASQMSAEDAAISDINAVWMPTYAGLCGNSAGTVEAKRLERMTLEYLDKRLAEARGGMTRAKELVEALKEQAIEAMSSVGQTQWERYSQKQEWLEDVRQRQYFKMGAAFGFYAEMHRFLGEWLSRVSSGETMR